jgi:uncharacterized protein
MKPTRIVIFAKAPIAGLAKTRLIPALGPQCAAQLAQRMLCHTLTTACASKLGPVELCTTPEKSDRAWLPFDIPHHVAISAQGDGDLGARMARAAMRTIEAGESAILIGTDCPAITVATLQAAAAALQDHDASLIPTFDGGYALLGLKCFDAGLFNNMTWSTCTVASETLARMKRMDWQVKVLDTLHDIDEQDDLTWLPTDWADALTAAHAAPTANI